MTSANIDHTVHDMSNDVSERRTSSSVRDTIIAALDSLESENEQLRDINSKVQDELSALERENQRLRNEIHQMKSDRHSFKHRIQEMEATQDELQQELQNNKLSVKESARVIQELRAKFSEERKQLSKQSEDLKNMLIQRDEAIRRAEQETEALHMRIERAARKNYSDRDIELLHEVELLKAQKRDLSLDNDDIRKMNKKLKHELNNLQTIFDEKEAELKNEGRRHSILTKEFNSLLDENNRLKLQIRRRSNPPSMLTNAFSSPSLESMDTTTVKDLNGSAENVNAPTLTSRNVLPRQPISREPSLIINNEPFQPTRENTLTSRDKRSSLTGHARMPGMTSREPSLVRRAGGNFSVRDGKKGGRPTAAKRDDRTTPDTLPALGHSSAHSAQTSKSK